LSLSLCPTAQSGGIDAAALAASCAQVRNAIKLSPDGEVLCFDGRIKSEPLDEIRKLAEGGTFVARSQGGNTIIAMLIADILLEKNATVVLHGYCLSACANVFFVASHSVHVVNDTMVAWHGGTPYVHCGPEPDSLKQDGSEATRQRIETYKLYCRHKELLLTFYRKRGITDDFVQRPQSRYSRKIFAAMLREAYDKTRIFWMWHPENFGPDFKSRIAFQSFPSSQDDVDKLLRRLRLPIRVVYDPPEIAR
jgi:hypothetical protein